VFICVRDLVQARQMDSSFGPARRSKRGGLIKCIDATSRFDGQGAKEIGARIVSAGVVGGRRKKSCGRTIAHRYLEDSQLAMHGYDIGNKQDILKFLDLNSSARVILQICCA
jgi:hypothetical protein